MATYVSKIPNLFIQGNTPAEDIKFSKGQFETADEKTVEFLDNLLKNVPGMAGRFRKVDEEEAKRALEAFMANQQQALKGLVSSGNENATMQARAAAENADLEAIKKANEATKAAADKSGATDTKKAAPLNLGK